MIDDWFAFASLGQPCVIDDWIGTYGFGPLRCAWRRKERLAAMQMYCAKQPEKGKGVPVRPRVLRNWIVSALMEFLDLCRRSCFRGWFWTRKSVQGHPSEDAMIEIATVEVRPSLLPYFVPVLV